MNGAGLFTAGTRDKECHRHTGASAWARGVGAAPPRVPVPVRERSRPRARLAPARLTSQSSQPTSARGASWAPPPAPSLPIKIAASGGRGTGVRGTGRDGRDGAAGSAPGTAARPRPARRAGAPLASRDAARGRRAPARRSCGRAGVAGPGAGEPAGQPLRVHLAAAGRRRLGLPAAPRAHAGRRAAPRGGAQSHRAAAAGDRPAAEGDHREPAGGHPGAHREAEPLRGCRRQVRRGGVEERGGQGQGHDGRPAAGPGAGHRAAEPHHADPEGPPGEPGGRAGAASRPGGTSGTSGALNPCGDASKLAQPAGERLCLACRGLLVIYLLFLMVNT